MRSAAAHRRAVLAVAEGRDGDAVSSLESAIKGWTELKMPFEAAQSRLLLAEARHVGGNASAARLELDSARSILERLGATGDVERIEVMLSS